MSTTRTGIIATLLSLLALPALAQTPSTPPPVVDENGRPIPAATPPPATPPPATTAPATTPATPPEVAPAPPPPATTDASVTRVAEPEKKKDRGAFVIGVKVGGLFAQPFSKLGPSFLVDLEVGYIAPFLKRSFALLIDAGYTQPTSSGTTTDPRIDANGGTYSYELTQREVILGLTVFYRATFIKVKGDGGGRLVPYIGIGPRLWLLQTLVQGTAGAGNVITQSKEQSTKVGLSVPLGLGFQIGPGSLFVEAQLLWAPVDHRITGDSSVGSITVEAGYRLML